MILLDTVDDGITITGGDLGLVLVILLIIAALLLVVYLAQRIR